MAARIGFVWTEEGADQRRSGIPTDETVAMAKFKNGMRPVHPGEILREDYLKELGMSANALAKALNVPAPRVNDIVRERRGITADTALRLALYFDSSPQSGSTSRRPTICAWPRGLPARRYSARWP